MAYVPHYQCSIWNLIISDYVLHTQCITLANVAALVLMATYNMRRHRIADSSCACCMRLKC